MEKKRKKKEHIKVGPRAQKALLLLQAGIMLSLTARPDVFFKIIRNTSKELKEIDERALRRAVASLYHSKLVDYQENNDGTTTLILTETGRNRALRYNLNDIAIKKPKKWDGGWRLVAFDIPERLKAGREALVKKLKEFGFYPVQKSIFIFPYECKNEIDFVIEVFELRPYVRFLLVKETDIDPLLKRKFELV